MRDTNSRSRNENRFDDFLFCFLLRSVLWENYQTSWTRLKLKQMTIARINRWELLEILQLEAWTKAHYYDKRCWILYNLFSFDAIIKKYKFKRKSNPQIIFARFLFFVLLPFSISIISIRFLLPWHFLCDLMEQTLSHSFPFFLFPHSARPRSKSSYYLSNSSLSPNGKLIERREKKLWLVGRANKRVGWERKEKVNPRREEMET